jgi:hypothetical protein
MRHRVLLSTLPVALSLAGCRTLDPGADKVRLVQTRPPNSVTDERRGRRSL